MRPRVGKGFRRGPRGRNFRENYTQAAGLVVIRPIVEALRDEYFYFAWLLRHEAFQRFAYDPDAVFSESVDGLGFKR